MRKELKKFGKLFLLVLKECFHTLTVRDNALQKKRNRNFSRVSSPVKCCYPEHATLR